MNKVLLIGRLTRDPEVRYGGANNSAVARFSLAVNRRFKQDNQPDADFINCVSFGKTAELIEQYISKGSKIGIIGRIQTGSYEKDGSKVYTTDVVVEELDFLDTKGTASVSNDKANANDGFMNIPDGAEEELPFN